MAAVGRVNRIIVDTDILLRHVVHPDPTVPSHLRALMGQYFCYTTVFNAIEAFGSCRTEEQRDAVERSMGAIKILGLNARSGKSIGELSAASVADRDLYLLISGVCLESRLPLVTGRKSAYEGIPGLVLKTPEELLTIGNAKGAKAGETK